MTASQVPSPDNVATVRRAEVGDVPGMLEIANHYAATTAANFAVDPETTESWTESFTSTSAMYPWLVVANPSNGAVYGFAKATPWKGRCAYNAAAEITVYVRADQHRCGHGRLLYNILFDVLERQGYRTLLAGITLPNDASVRLHESFGMKQCATFENIGWKFQTWHTVGYWIRHFGDGSAPGPIKPVDECYIS